MVVAVLYGILHAPMYEHVPDLTLYSDLAMAFKIMLKIMRFSMSKIIKNDVVGLRGAPRMLLLGPRGGFARSSWGMVKMISSVCHCLATVFKKSESMIHPNTSFHHFKPQINHNSSFH